MGLCLMCLRMWIRKFMKSCCCQGNFLKRWKKKEGEVEKKEVVANKQEVEKKVVEENQEVENKEGVANKEEVEKKVVEENQEVEKKEVMEKKE